MADIRVTTGGKSELSRIPGTQVGVQMNTFGMQKLLAGLTGEDLVEVLVEGIQPAYDELKENWPVLTGASNDSIEVAVLEVNPRSARVVLQVGGPQLIADPRNKSGKDYAPFIEYNGSPSGSVGPGIMTYSFAVRDREMRKLIHAGVSALIKEILR